MRISAGPVVPGFCSQAIRSENSPAIAGTGSGAVTAGKLLTANTPPAAPLLPSSSATTLCATCVWEVTKPWPYSVIATAGSPALSTPGLDSPSAATAPSYCEPCSRFINTLVCCEDPHARTSWKATSA